MKKLLIITVAAIFLGACSIDQTTNEEETLNLEETISSETSNLSESAKDLEVEGEKQAEYFGDEDMTREEAIERTLSSLEETEDFMVVYNEYSDAFFYVPEGATFLNAVDKAVESGTSTELWSTVMNSLSNLSELAVLGVDENIRIVLLDNRTDEVLAVFRNGEILFDAVKDGGPY